MKFKKYRETKKEAIKNIKKRSKLSQYEGLNISLYATITAFGKTTLSSGVPQKTVLLTNINNQYGTTICNHIWIHLNEIKNFDKLKDIINIGDEVFLESAEPYAYYCEHNNKISHAKYSLKNIYIGSNFPKKI